MSVLDYKPRFRCARDSKRPLERATWDDVVKYGGVDEALRKIERKTGQRMMQPIAGGALSLVNSGTVTPTVGTNSAVDTETPSFPTMYVMEVDTSAMQTGDYGVLTIRNTAASPKPGFQLLGVAAGAGGNTDSILTPALTPVGHPVVAVIGNPSTSTAPSIKDSQSNTYTQLASVNGFSGSGPLAVYYVTNPLPLPGTDWENSFSLSSADWMKVPAVASAQTLIAGGFVQGASFVSTPYASNTASANSSSPSVTTASNVTAGDLVFAVMGTGTSGTVTPPGGWTVVYNAAAANGTVDLLICVQIASSTTTYTFAPALGGTEWWGCVIGAFPVMTGGTPLARLGLRGNTPNPIKQSHPILINTSASVEFDLLQTAGTARAFPWKIWHL